MPHDDVDREDENNIRKINHGEICVREKCFLATRKQLLLATFSRGRAGALNTRRGPKVEKRNSSSEMEKHKHAVRFYLGQKPKFLRNLALWVCTTI